MDDSEDHAHTACTSLCILHRLAPILEPVTRQEVSRLSTVSLVSQTLLLDVRGCTAGPMPCDGVWGLPSLLPKH